MKHIILTTSLLLLISIVTLGQEKLQLSLAEAQDYAIEHNKSLQSSRLEIESSERKIKEAIAQGLPQVDATMDWMTYFNHELNIFQTPEMPGTEIVMNAMNDIMTKYPGVTQQDFVNYTAMNEFQNILFPQEPIIMSQASTAKFQVGQLLFSGQYWVGIKVAKLGQRIAEQGLENSILDVKESIANSYYMILITEKTIETFKKSIDNLNIVKGHTENMFSSGMAERTDVDQLSIQVKMLENTLLSMERGLLMLESMMKFQLGIDSDNEIMLTENLDEVIALLNPTMKIGEFNLNNNTTYKIIEGQEDITRKMIDMEKMAYAPTITGFYAHNLKLITSGLDMNPRNVAGVSMSLPIFSSGMRKQKVAQAKIELDKVQLNKSMVEDQLKIQQKQLLLDLETAIENYDSQKENVEIAKRVFSNIQNKYEQGMASSLDLTQTNSNYLQAESNYIQSIMALLQAKIAIDKLYNQL